MKRIGVASFVLVMGMALPAAAQFDGSTPQGPLNTAKDLYASARYDEALSVLNGLRIGESADRKSVEQYRSLCLLALGRASEAETAIAAVVTADPTYRPGESDASPRVRATFTDVRKRLLPEIATAPLSVGEGCLRSQGMGGRRTAVPHRARPPRRSGHGRPARRSARADRRLPRAQRARRGTAASASGRTEADLTRAGHRAAGGDGCFAAARAAGPIPGKIYTAEDAGSPSAGRRPAGHPAACRRA